MSIKENKKVYPGSFLGYIHEYTIGPTGVFSKNNKLYSSLYGEVCINDETNPPTISVSNGGSAYLPKVNDDVYAKITKVQKTQAICEIFANSKGLIRTMQGIIKHENIKNDYKDFDIFDCLVPGDIILGRILAVDKSNYIYVKISDTDNGVIFAKSQLSGNLMMPMSSLEMECLETHDREKRKVAKPNIPQ